MKKTFLRIALLSLPWGFLFTACTKDDQDVQPQEPQTEEIAVNDNTTGLSESDEVVAIVEDALDRGGAAMRVSAEQETYVSAYGATITVQKNGDGTGNITVDFGAGTTGRDGRTRKGKIFIAYTGSYRTHNSRQVVTFGNYYVNDNQVEGQKTLLTTIDNSTGSYPIFVSQIEVASGKITWKDGKTTEWSGERTRKYDYKNTLTDFNDDVVTITGTAVGKGRNGIGFTAATTAPLVVKISCALSQKSWLPLAGVLEVTPEAGTRRTVSYGSGDCDRTFSVTANGRTWNITLRQ